MRADAPYKNANELVAAIKANPGKFKASGTGQGGIWHLALAGMLKDLKVDPAAAPWVPSNGAAPGLQDLVAGGVEIVPCSLPEARSLIDAGKVKSLAVMSDAPAGALPERADAEGGDRQRLEARRLARHRRAQGPARRTSATSSSPRSGRSPRARSTPTSWAAAASASSTCGPDEFGRFMAKSDTDLGATMKAVGIVK